MPPLIGEKPLTSAERQRRYRERLGADVVKEKRHLEYLANKEKVAEQSRAWALANPEKVIEKAKNIVKNIQIELRNHKQNIMPSQKHLCVSLNTEIVKLARNIEKRGVKTILKK